MAKTSRRQTLDVADELLAEFEHSGRVTAYFLGTIPMRIWRSPPPGGEGRTIAAIAAHMQSLRRTFAKMGGEPGLPPLDRLTSTPVDARRALVRSTDALTRLFADAIASGQIRTGRMPRRTIDMMLYIVQHDAHHRGQISRLARELGYRLPKDVLMRLWGWKKL